MPSERFGYLQDCGSNVASKHACRNEAHLPQVKKKKSSILIQMILVLFCTGVSNVGAYERNTWYNLSHLFLTYCQLSTKVSISWQCFETSGVISYGSGWRKDVINWCLEFVAEPGVGQNIALHAVPAARCYAFLISAFIFHLTSLFPSPKSSQWIRLSLVSCRSMFAWSQTKPWTGHSPATFNIQHLTQYLHSHTRYNYMYKVLLEPQAWRRS